MISIFELTRARLPWLILGLIGGIGAAFIMGGFDEILMQHKDSFLLYTLIAAMAGNVGVQSSAIIVQGLANSEIKGSINNRLFKETLLSVLNGSYSCCSSFCLYLFMEGPIFSSPSFINITCSCNYCCWNYWHIYSVVFEQ